METAAQGATSVAEAVKRVADAVVAEVHKVKPPEKTDLTAVGSPGGRLTVESLTPGAGFGPSGTLKVGGVQIHTREWSTTRIIGDLPREAVNGAEVVVHVDDKVQRRGKLVA